MRRPDADGGALEDFRSESERRLEIQRAALFKAAGMHRTILAPWALVTHARPDQVEALRRVLGERRLSSLFAIDRALERIVTGRFGRCDGCDAEISRDLLARSLSTAACATCASAPLESRPGIP